MAARSRAEGCTRVLTRLQRGLERMYRVATGVEVDDFVIGDDARGELGVARAPREQLLVHQDDDGVDVGLFVDAAVLANLATHDPGARLDDRNLAAFLYAVEGVSHFVYAIVCARAARAVSALELELQAEVDKYVVCLLADGGAPAASPRWRRRLFEDFELEPDLDAEERDRYRAANDGARRYAASLERRYVARRGTVDMLAELRRFYRLPLASKLDHIAKAA
ncbi:MAG: hypothetical protein HS111_13430 [Kofleriaceae bacterium]|nr:hypothetical protein [Kofleriaceae bacterium]MCL4229000.1 hypothetical protein [Myxococcales bacterium]